MPFRPISMLLKRVEDNGDSDSLLFTELLYAAEFVTKTTVAGFVACIEDDRERHRYRMLHALVRADGIGDWAAKLDEMLTGPTSQHFAQAINDDRRIFTERVGPNTWQHDAVKEMQTVLAGVFPAAQGLSEKVSLRTWFTKFAEVRNKTRGHGAITPATCAKLVPHLRKSIHLVIDNNPIFQRPWAYLHRNLSGKYKVVNLSDNTSTFDALKSNAAAQGENYPDGIYIFSGRPRRVDLLSSDVNAADFYVPNGAFNGKTFELHSLLTDSRLTGDATPYLAVATDRPPSETEGRRELDLIGKVFANLPAIPDGYVRRPKLEEDVRAAITNDRHPVVTLVGRGGIGKTSLVLAILHEVAKSDRYQVILWFSARDIDLTMSGPKVVQPKILAERDVAEEYKSLIFPLIDSEESEQKINPLQLMARHMRSSPLGPTLFVFDNFETARSPIDLFQWIDTNIRLPNKVVITSRFREFKADFPIEVSGMEIAEAEALVQQTARALRIDGSIKPAQVDQIIEESDGHPYVIKIILGEIASTGSFSKPSKLIARKGEILDALFERTYTSLSPMATRIFLMLSGWRSLVPQIAVEAVLARHDSEGGDPERAIDELIRMSLVERTRAPDDADFLAVPLTAALFGIKKLEVSPQRQLIEGEIRFLQDLGATAITGLKDGIGPRVEALIKKIAIRINGRTDSLDEFSPMLEFLARNYPPAWLLLADLQAEVRGDTGLDISSEYIRRLLETKPTAKVAQEAWQRLINLYRETNNVLGACSAFVSAAEISEPPLHQISNMAMWLNNQRDAIEKMDFAERGALFKPMARLMERHLPEASATDLSRLAWLHLHAGDEKRAFDLAELGLRREEDNQYCQRLVDKLRK